MAKLLGRLWVWQGNGSNPKAALVGDRGEIDKRSDIFASGFFETQKGQRFISRLVVACIFIFGIASGIAANPISRLRH